MSTHYAGMLFDQPAQSSISMNAINKQLQQLQRIERRPKAFPRPSLVSYDMAAADSDDSGPQIEEVPDIAETQLATFHSEVHAPLPQSVEGCNFPSTPHAPSAMITSLFNTGRNSSMSSSSTSFSTTTMPNLFDHPPPPPQPHSQSRRRDNLFWPWWRGDAAEEWSNGIFLVKTKLSGNREGLLVDPGAYDNLVGSNWVKRMTQLAISHACHPTYSRIKQLGVQGVGKSCQSTSTRVSMPICLKGMAGHYSAPVVGTESDPVSYTHLRAHETS